MKTKHFQQLLVAIPLSCVISGQPLAEVQEKDFSLQSTQDLYDVCSATEGDEHNIPAVYLCRGFIEGVVQYHDAVSVGKDYKRVICYPPSATLADARQTFIAWGQANAVDSNLMTKAPVVGLVRALAAKYPCGN